MTSIGQRSLSDSRIELITSPLGRIRMCEFGAGTSCKLVIGKDFIGKDQVRRPDEMPIRQTDELNRPILVVIRQPRVEPLLSETDLDVKGLERRT